MQFKRISGISIRIQCASPHTPIARQGAISQVQKHRVIQPIAVKKGFSSASSVERRVMCVGIQVAFPGNNYTLYSKHVLHVLAIFTPFLLHVLAIVIL